MLIAKANKREVTASIEANGVPLAHTLINYATPVQDLPDHLSAFCRFDLPAVNVMF